jgi:hypothetical protein
LPQSGHCHRAERLSEQNTIINLVKKQAGNEFRVEVRAIPEIDWRGSVKRLGFYNEVL